MSDLSLRPGLSLGSYPQRREDPIDELEASLRGWLERQRKRLLCLNYGQKALAFAGSKGFSLHGCRHR